MIKEIKYNDDTQTDTDEQLYEIEKTVVQIMKQQLEQRKDS